MMNQVLQFGKQHSGSVDPRVRAQGTAMMNELQSKLRTAEDQGVYKQSEAEFMRSTLGGSPAEFFSNFTTSPRVKQIQAIKQADYDNTLKNYGLPVQKPQQAPQYKTVNGVRYMRGPDGKAIPVGQSKPVGQ
jgi:hypothetical protein